MPVNSTVEPGYLVKQLPGMLMVFNPKYVSRSLTCTTDQAPEKGEDFSVIARDFQTQIMPGITHWQHPSFFAYFPSITNFESILADMYATSVSNPGFNVSDFVQQMRVC
jgi:aromatic-L-amino-acid decarboxylase